VEETRKEGIAEGKEETGRGGGRGRNGQRREGVCKDVLHRRKFTTTVTTPLLIIRQQFHVDLLGDQRTLIGSHTSGVDRSQQHAVPMTGIA